MSVNLWLTDNDLNWLHEDTCPFCGNDLEFGHRFQQEDGRHGGLMDCPECGIRIAWIDSPFEWQIEALEQ